jgi:hypothetical protein
VTWAVDDAHALRASTATTASNLRTATG